MVVQSKDPPTFIILLEDSAAMIGISIAALGIYGSIWFDEPRLDGFASVLIAITLAMAAIVPARETKGLLIGEAASKKTRDRSEEHTYELQSLMRTSDAVFG